MQIIVRNITYIYDYKMPTAFKALDDVSTIIGQPEFIAIIGHTGSGKTTFIEHLNALIRPNSGEVQIGDYLVTSKKRKLKNVKEIRKRVGVVFQFAEYQLFEETILKDIIFGPVSMGVKKDEAKVLAEKYIQLVGLDIAFLDRSPFSLSGGQKRRVAIAGILAMEPDILVFDEPTAGLDPQGEKDIYEIFHKLHEIGKTIVVVTHNLDHVLEHSKRTIMFRKGKIIKDTNSLDLMYERDFLVQNGLQPPKLVTLVDEIEQLGKRVGKVRSIEELAYSLTKGGPSSE